MLEKEFIYLILPFESIDGYSADPPALASIDLSGDCSVLFSSS